MSDPFGGNPFQSANFSPFGEDPFAFKPNTLVPYVQEEVTKREQKFSLLEPVKWIFDILSRGQYLTADVGKSIIKSVRTGEPLDQSAMDAISAAVRGITGQEKGDWQNVLFGEKPDSEGKAFEGLFPDSALPNWAKKVIGFVANVALDPTSYVSFGATGAARSAAAEAAKEATQIALKELGNTGKLASALRAGMDVAKVDELVAKGAQGFDELTKYASKYAPDISKYLNDVYKKTFSQTLRMPAGDIQKMMLTRGEEASKLGPDIAEGLAPLMERIRSVPYNQGAGMVAMKLGPLGIGRDIGEKPASQSMAIQAWDAISNKFKSSPVGEGLGNAWWAINNKGPLKAIRDAFGIRTGNPLSQWAHNIDLSAADRTRAEVGQAIKKSWETAQSIPEELQAPLVAANMLSESIRRLHPEEAGVFAPIENVIKNPEWALELLQNSEKLPANQRVYLIGLAQQLTQVQDRNALAQAAVRLRELTDSWQETTKKAVAAGILPKEHFMEDYLPNYYDFAKQYSGAGKSAASQFNTERKFTKAEATSQDINWMQTLFGVDTATADRLVREKGLGSIVSDLPTMLAYRAQAEAKLKSRIAMVEDFRQFGIPEKDIDFALKQGVIRNSADLQRVSGTPYEGLLFPKDVADVMTKVESATTDPGMRGFMRLWGGFTTWWRGFSTLSGGFHVRNFIQDNFTDYLHHGFAAFNPTTYKDALVATVYALAKDNPNPLLEKLGMKLIDYNKVLAKKYADMSVQELADYSLREGLISRFGRAFDAQTYGKIGLNANPASVRFAPIASSRRLEEIMSNTDRMKFFFNELSGVTKHTPQDLAAKMAEYAPPDVIEGLSRFKKVEADLTYSTLETKKWLFDYADLSQFEKRVMKNIFPFYTWIRKNIPAQLATILTNPSIYAIIPKGEEALTNGVDVPSEAIPDWLRVQGSIPVSKDEKGNPTFWFPNLGYEDINKIPLLFGPHGIPKIDLKNIKDEIMSIAHPVIKDVVQLIPEKGYDVFYKRDLNYKAPAPYLMQYFLKVPFMMQATDGLLKAAGIQEGLGAVKDDQGQIRIDAKIAKVLEDNLPILRVIERTMIGPVAAIPGLDQAVNAVKVDDPVKMTSQFFKLLSFWGGIKFNTYDVEQEKARFRNDVMAAASESKSAQGRYTPMAKVRSLKYQQSQQKRAAKYGL